MHASTTGGWIPEFEFPRLIPLTQGQYALVDAWAYDELARHDWCYHHGYARRAHGNQKLHMHRIVLELAGIDLAGMIPDHINRDGLDNRLSNLRPATKVQNRINTPPRDGFKGVSYCKREQRWRAQIFDGKNRSLGYFDTPQEAATVYDAAAFAAFGHFAWLNYPLMLAYQVGPTRIRR